MTYEQLILAIANDLPQFNECGLKVLFSVIAKGIEDGSSTVVVSKQQMADRTGLSREGVARGTREIQEIVPSTPSNGLHTRYLMPEEWFTPQKSLFAMPDTVENRPHLPRFQAGTRLDSRQLPANDPGSTRQDSRQQLPTFQAAAANIPGSTRQDSRQICLDSRQVPTQNQQLTDGSLDRSNRDLSSMEVNPSIRDSIEGVNFLPADLMANGEKLKGWLRSFFAKHHHSGNPPDGPDQIIVAKCLAIAPLDRLARVLTSLDNKGTRPGDTWAWFVTVFCQRIHGTKNTSGVHAPAGFHQTKKKPSTESGASFRNGLLQEVTAAAGQMR